MIVDTCHLAATVDGPSIQEFKPGPMGNSWVNWHDKGMRILAARQTDDVAIESQQIRQGLLTNSLARATAFCPKRYDQEWRSP